MTGKEISDIVMIICLVGWIPIYFFFGGIAKVILMIKCDSSTINNNKICEIKLENNEENEAE